MLLPFVVGWASEAMTLQACETLLSMSWAGLFVWYIRFVYGSLGVCDSKRSQGTRSASVSSPWLASRFRPGSVSTDRQPLRLCRPWCGCCCRCWSVRARARQLLPAGITLWLRPDAEEWLVASVGRTSTAFYRSSTTSDPWSSMRLACPRSALRYGLPGSWENRVDDVTHTDVGLWIEGSLRANSGWRNDPVWARLGVFCRAVLKTCAHWTITKCLLNGSLHYLTVTVSLQFLLNIYLVCCSIIEGHKTLQTVFLWVFYVHQFFLQFIVLPARQPCWQARYCFYRRLSICVCVYVSVCLSDCPTMQKFRSTDQSVV